MMSQKIFSDPNKYYLALMNRIKRTYEYFYWKNRVVMDGSVRISLKAKIVGGRNIRIASRVIISDYVILDCSESPFSPSLDIMIPAKGEIFIGEGSRIRSFACLFTYGGTITLGSNCSLNPFSIIYGHGDVTIGDNVRIASHCTLVSSSHKFDEPDIPIYQQGVRSKGIVIDDDVWLGTGVKVLDGVHVHSGSIIASGAVVTKDVQPMSVYAGVPAKLIRNRDNI